MENKRKDNKNKVNEEKILEEFATEYPANDELNKEKPKHRHHDDEETEEA